MQPPEGRRELRDNVDAQRYELTIDGQLVGIAEYRLHGDVVVVPHSEIAAPLRGNGLGAELVQAVLDDVRSRGRTIVPRCWYVAEYMREHPESADLLATTSRDGGGRAAP